MTLGAFLTSGRILVGHPGRELHEVVEALREAAFRPASEAGREGKGGGAAADPGGGIPPAARPPAIRRLGEAALLVLEESAPEDSAALAITASALPLEPEEVAGGDPERDAALRIFLFVARSAGSRIGPEGLKKLEGRLARPEVVTALLRAATPEAVRGIAPLMGVHLTPTLRVSDAVVPLALRIYPDTPVGEILDLMARKGVNALPVVGESMQVLGILTAGDALRLLLDREDRSALVARDVMTRTVLCVTEEQELEEAARIMVQRNLRQLPVVREGEMVGFLHREPVLATLFHGKRLDRSPPPDRSP